MGTLTANLPRLESYCDHKLPTSCRLSSIGECCACYDERAHAATYTTYVDGIGLVPRGTRWQRYCWFCKEFWTARVAASGLRPGQTRIPQVPDQGPFLDRWYEFHRGWRVIVKEDGSEERVAVLGEDLRDVEPGHLPRTLEELREGRQRSEIEAAEREVQLQQQQQQRATQEEEPAGPSLEDTLDQLFLDASAGESAAPVPITRGAQPTQNVHAQAMVAAGSRNREYQARRIAALRRELHRMRNGIERVIAGLREFGENVPDAGEATGQLTMLGRTLDDISGAPSGNQADLAIRSVNEVTNNVAASQSDQTLAAMQTRVEEAREHVNEARRMRDQAASEFDVAEQEFNTSNRRLQQLQRDQRTAENYTRIFGTREEIQAQGDDYESPVGGMFSRAYERFNVAEQVRQEERTLRQVLEDERRNGDEDGVRRLEEFENMPRDVWGVRRPPQLLQDSTSNTTHLMEEARDEVFAGQTLAQMAQEAQQVAELAGDEPPGHNDNDDTTLEEYYSLLRRQGWSQQAPEGTQGVDSPARNVPDSYPAGFVAALERADQTREQLQRNNRESQVARTSSPVEPYSSTAVDRREDLVHVLHYIRTHEDWIEELGLDVNQVYMGLVICASSLNNMEIVEDLMPRMSAVMGGLDPTSLLQRDDLVWKSGLPAARLVRIRRAGQQVSFSNQPQTTDTEVMRGNMEVMAEVFQMSARLRRKSGLTAQEQLNMMNRLQSGERRDEDRTILASMLLEDDTVQLAANVHRHHLGSRETETEQQAQLNAQRREAARDGDFSRQSLNAQRREASAFALAAGRLAMQRTAMEQDAHVRRRLMERFPEGYQRMLDARARPRTREQLIDWSSESDEEEDQEQGLDARDSGRPEPKTEEEMEVKLECRICYSQVADVACLPCGHLVMCKWCSEQHSPTMQHDRTRPRRAAGCPVCRKGIRQKVRVFRA